MKELNLHSILEKYLIKIRDEGIDEIPLEFDTNIVILKHLHQFQRYLLEHNLKPVEIEKSVYNNEYKIAGTIDCIFAVIGTDERILVDFKRKPCIKKVNYFDKHTSIIADTEYNKISIQLNLYKFLLNDEHVNKLVCIAIYPNNDDIIIEEFPIDNNLVQKVINRTNEGNVEC